MNSITIVFFFAQLLFVGVYYSLQCQMEILLELFLVVVVVVVMVEKMSQKRSPEKSGALVIDLTLCYPI